MPTSATTRRSASGISGPSVVTWLAGSALIWAAVCTRCAVSTSGSRRRGRVLAHVGVGHPGEPVEALGRPRRQASPARRPGSPGRAAGPRRRARAVRRPIGRGPRTGRCSSSSAIATTSRHHVGHQPGFQPVGPAVAGSVEADQPDPELVEHPALRERPDAAPRRAVQYEHRMAGRVSRHLARRAAGRPPNAQISSRAGFIARNTRQKWTTLKFPAPRTSILDGINRFILCSQTGTCTDLYGRNGGAARSSRHGRARRSAASA